MKNFLLILWQLPQILAALVMWPFLGKKTLVAKNEYTKAYLCERMQGSISLGVFIFLSPYGAGKDEVITHEFGHTWQSRLLGWFYLIVIGLPSILNAWIGFTKCYYDWYPEKWANNIQGLITNEYCGLVQDGIRKVAYQKV